MSALMKSFLELTAPSCESFYKIIFTLSAITVLRLVCEVTMVKRE